MTSGGGRRSGQLHQPMLRGIHSGYRKHQSLTLGQSAIKPRPSACSAQRRPAVEGIQLNGVVMRDVPMLYEFQRGSVHLFHGKIGHAAEIDGALALSAWAAFHSLF